MDSSEQDTKSTSGARSTNTPNLPFFFSPYVITRSTGQPGCWPADLPSTIRRRRRGGHAHVEVTGLRGRFQKCGERLRLRITLLTASPDNRAVSAQLQRDGVERTHPDGPQLPPDRRRDIGGRGDRLGPEPAHGKALQARGTGGVQLQQGHTLRARTHRREP